MSTLIRPETKATILGVSGRWGVTHAWDDGRAPGLFMHQTFIATRPDPREGGRQTVELRFSDNPKNGHNTFAITCMAYDARGRESYGGSAHDDIARVFPEFAHLIKWHLVSSDGPMHYVGNTVYLAGDRDHRKKRAGEPYAFDDAVVFGDNPIKHVIKSEFAKFLKEAATTGLEGAAFDFEVLQISESKKSTVTGKQEYYHGWTFGGFASKWYECPFKSEAAALDFLKALQNNNPQFVRIPTLWSEGKARELDSARRAAVWPEATDAELSQEPEALTAALVARLPGLLDAFRADLEAAGFYWDAAEMRAAMAGA